LLFSTLFLLSADPSILLDSGQVGDEGFWNYSARSLHVFGKLPPDDFYHDIAVSPLFTIFSFISFSMFGAGFWQARFVSAFSGLLTVLFTYLIASRYEKKVGLISSLVLCGIFTILPTVIVAKNYISYFKEANR